MLSYNGVGYPSFLFYLFFVNLFIRTTVFNQSKYKYIRTNCLINQTIEVIEAVYV